MKFVIQLILSIIASTSLLAQGVDFHENPNWKDMLKIAKNENKIIFVDCYTAWCGPCQGLAKHIFPKKEVGDMYNKNFINVKYDVEKGTGVEFRKLYKEHIIAFPTLLFIDPKTGNVVHKFVGSRPVDEIVQEAVLCLEGRGLSALKMQYDNGVRDFGFMTLYFEALYRSERRGKVLPLIDEYLQKYDGYESLKDKEKWDFYGKYIGDLDLGFVQYLINNRYAFSKLSFVDQIKLDKDLSFCIKNAINNLTEIKYDEVEHVYKFIGYTKDKHVVVRENIAKLKNKEHNSLLPRLVISEYLQDKKWENAYYAINSSVDFQIIEIDYLYPILMCYLAQENKDVELTTKIYYDLIKYQEKGEKRIQHFNAFDRIAFVAKILGKDQDSKEAMENYNRIQKERDKMYSNKTKRRA